MNRIVLAILLFAAAHSLALPAARDMEIEEGEPGWAAYHRELEHTLTREVEAARLENVRPPRNQSSEAQESSDITGNGYFEAAQQRSPEKLVDDATMDWLASALSRPIPEELAMRAIFRDERVPEELIYVGLVESGYSRHAVSNAGAVGPWQFINETGRRYGLKQGKNKDERRDLIKSTRAAARYLRDLRDLLGNWNLALAGYNAGENRVLRAIQKARTRDFWTLRMLLPNETAQYVPRVLAAISIAKTIRPRAAKQPEPLSAIFEAERMQ